MSILERIEIVHGDVRDIAADILILKYANGLYGAELAVAERIGGEFHVPSGRVRSSPGRGVAAAEVAFVGVGDLFEFRYEQIRNFGAFTLQFLTEHPAARVAATTIHGPGYGLDERESFASQLEGYLDFTSRSDIPIDKLIIVEQSATRARRLSTQLAEMSAQIEPLPDDRLREPEEDISSFSDMLQKDFGPQTGRDNIRHKDLIRPGDRRGDARPKLFVAMPFADEHRDEYDIAFVEAANDNGYLCERLDLESYTGDVVAEIERRIRESAGMIALLNDHNPNVFLEIGYAMALSKTIIFVARNGQTIPFDIRNQRRVEYSRIAALRDDLRALISALKNSKVL